MRVNAIGRTSTRVTGLGFGSAPIGNLYSQVSDETALGAVEAAWNAGIRYFDTAPHYGLGLAERRLGRALARYPRSAFALSTKVGRLLVPNPAPAGSDLAAGGFAVSDELTRERDYSADVSGAASTRASSGWELTGSTSCSCTIRTSTPTRPSRRRSRR